MEENIVRGCELSPVDLRDFKLNTSMIDTSIIPDEYNAMPQHKIKSQGNVGACVAFALTTILEQHEQNIKLSTNFIYGGQNVVYGFTMTGMFLRVAASIAKRFGVPEYSKCPGNTEVPEVYKIAEEAFNDLEVLDDAYKHKIKSYVNLLGNKTNIKYAIMNYGPVLASLRWYDDYKYNKETGFVDFKKNLKFSYHAIVIYGWDKEGWLCQNSWGTRWGSNGLFKLYYTDGPREAFALIDDEDLDSSSIIKRPAQNSKFIDYVLRFINAIIAKFIPRK